MEHQLKGESPLLASACLLGLCTRYDGGANPHPVIQALAAQGCVVPICPEVAGGLPVPRSSAEIQGGCGDDVLDDRAHVVTADGQNVTGQYLAGARVALEAARRFGIRQAVLKAGSPSCGVGRIYDGTFSGCLRSGDGVTAALLKRDGMVVYSEKQVRRDSS